MSETEPQTPPMIRFRRGLPGFPGDRSFCLLRWGAGDGVYSLLVDPEDPTVRFLVVPPGLFFPTYEVELDDATVAQLEVDRVDEVLLLVIVTLHERPEDATANLLGPLVINTGRREGLQFVLPDSHWGTRVPLLPATTASTVTPHIPAQSGRSDKEPAPCSS